MYAVSPEQGPQEISTQKQQAAASSEVTILATMAIQEQSATSSSVSTISSEVLSEQTPQTAAIATTAVRCFVMPKKMSFEKTMTLLWKFVRSNDKAAIREIAVEFIKKPPVHLTQKQRMEFFKTLLVLGEKDLIAENELEDTLSQCGTTCDPVTALLCDLKERRDYNAITALLQRLTHNPPAEFPLADANVFLHMLVTTQDSTLLASQEILQFLSAFWSCEQAMTLLETEINTKDQKAIKTVLSWIAKAPPSSFSIWGAGAFFLALLKTCDAKLLCSAETQAFIDKEWTCKDALAMLETLLQTNDLQATVTFLNFFEKHPPFGLAPLAKYHVIESLLRHANAQTQACKEVQAFIRTTCNTLPRSLAMKIIDGQIVLLLARKETLDAASVKNALRELSMYRVWDLEAKIHCLVQAENNLFELLCAELKKDQKLSTWFLQNHETRYWKMLCECRGTIFQEESSQVDEENVLEPRNDVTESVEVAAAQNENQSDLSALKEQCVECKKSNWHELCQHIAQAVQNSSMTRFLEETERCDDFDFCKKLVHTLLSDTSSISLSQAQIALGALLYFRDHAPSNIPTDLTDITRSVPQLIAKISDHYKAVFETGHPNNKECTARTAQIRLASGKKLAFDVSQIEQNMYAQTLGKMILGKDGKVHLLLLPLMEQLLLAPSQSRGDFDNHMVAVFHQLRSQKLLLDIVDSVHCSKDAAINETIIRSTVGVPSGTAICDLHAKQAVVIAALLYWRQREFGSCSVNAVSLSAQELYLVSFMQDMATLVATGELVRRVEGEERRFVAIVPKKSHLLDMPLDVSGSSKSIIKILTSIPQLEEALILSGAMQREANCEVPSKTFLEIAVDGAREQKICTLRSILTLLPKEKQIDIAHFEFLLGAPIFRMFEHALASLPFTSFASHHSYPYYDQQKFISIVVAAVYDLLASDAFKDLSEERILAFIRTLPSQMRTSIFTLCAAQCGQSLSSQQRNISPEALITELDGEYEAFSKLRFFAKAPYEVEEIAHFSIDEGFVIQLYEETNGGFRPVDEERFQSIVHHFVEEVLQKIDPYYAVPSFSVAAVLQKYRPYLFEFDAPSVSQKQEEAVQNHEIALLEQTNTFTQFLSKPRGDGIDAIYETYLQLKKQEERIDCTSAKKIMEQLIQLKETLHVSQSSVAENFVSKNSVHLFRTFLHLLPDAPPTNSFTDFPLSQLPHTMKLLQTAIIEAIAKQKKVPRLQVELFLRHIAIPQATNLKDFWSNFTQALKNTKWLKDIAWEGESYDIVMKALLSGLKEERPKYKVIPFADTNWTYSRYCFLFNPLEDTWKIGVFDEHDNFREIADNQFANYSVTISSLPEVKCKDRLISQIQHEDDVAAVAEQFAVAWGEYQKHKPSRDAAIYRDLANSRTLDEMSAVVHSSKYKNKRYLQALIEIKRSYDQKVAALVSTSNPPVTDPLQPLFAVCFGRSSAIREALIGDVSAFKTLL